MKTYKKEKNLPYFPAISSQKFGFWDETCQICGKQTDMEGYVETAYDCFCMIASSELDVKSRIAAVEELKNNLGKASAVLEDMIYERLGLSSEEIVELLETDSVLP